MSYHELKAFSGANWMDIGCLFFPFLFLFLLAMELYIVCEFVVFVRKRRICCSLKSAGLASIAVLSLLGLIVGLTPQYAAAVIVSYFLALLPPIRLVFLLKHKKDNVFDLDYLYGIGLMLSTLLFMPILLGYPVLLVLFGALKFWQI